jgi:hypothetical protein
MAYPDGEVSIEQAVPEDDDKISNSTDIDDKSDTTGTDGKQIEELVVDSTEED